MTLAKGLSILFLLLLFSGCRATSSAREVSYRDPITYSFEAYTPPPKEKDPLLQFFTGIQDSARQIKEWEKKHLW